MLSCKRCEDTLVTLSKEDVAHLLQEQVKLIWSEYCGAHYIFTEEDIIISINYLALICTDSI